MSAGTWLHATIGRYTLTEFVGAGGMGEVYRATALGSGAPVAVKMLTRARDSVALRARFRNEARIHAELRHTHIARMIEYLEPESIPAIVMEYVDGDTVEQHLACSGAFSLADTVAHTMALTDAVAYLQRRTIVHRDIKSTNVKIDTHGVIKLLDFGIAKGPDSPALTAAGSVIGTLQALAPEQLLGAPADLQTEVWALGVLLYEMVTGRHPFADARSSHGGGEQVDNSTEGITARIRAGRYESASRAVPALPPRVDAVIARCLAVDRRRRYDSCEVLAADLRRITAASRTVAARGRSPLRRGLTPLLGALGITVALTLYWGTRDDVPSDPLPGGAVSARASEGSSERSSEGASGSPNTTARTNSALRAVTINTLNGPAEVWQDDVRVGTTPFVLQRRLGDDVNIVLRRDGYRSETVEFTVTEGRSEYSYVLQLSAMLPERRDGSETLLVAFAWFGFPWRRRREAPASDALRTRDHPVPALVAHDAASRIIVGLATDPGCVRHVNEDAVRLVRAPAGGIRQGGLLAVVCDGMGGHAAGETASTLATEVIAAAFLGPSADTAVSSHPAIAAATDPGPALAEAVALANRAIHAAARTDAALQGMGTTCVALMVRGERAWCAHVGDSRCYLLRSGQIFAMTEDHSAVMELVRGGTLSRAEAREHPDRNVISRALGSRRDIDVSTWPRPFMVRPGDRLLLSSDGLHDVVTEDEILEIAGVGAPDVACRALVARTRALGAPDNVSVMLLAVPATELDGGTRTVPVLS